MVRAAWWYSLSVAHWEVNMLSRFGVVLLLVLAAAAIATAQEQVPAQATVSSMGEAVIRRAPDRATITMSTSARGRSPQEAKAKGSAGGPVPVASGEIEIRMRVVLTATLK
jgi:uncharacterized protein YggE